MNADSEFYYHNKEVSRKNPETTNLNNFNITEAKTIENTFEIIISKAEFSVINYSSFDKSSYHRSFEALNFYFARISEAS